MTEAKFSIGVDLGTTHSALSFAALEEGIGEPTVEAHSVTQLVTPGATEARSLLPSFLYLPHAAEFAPNDLVLPWSKKPVALVGELARTTGASTPMRLVSSAKSWLCHAGVDRRGPILPLDAPDDVARVSPLDASVAYLEHLRHAWDQEHRGAPFSKQEVVLTVPASFDPAARELTAEAAARAGYENVTLLEEPQAALYSWIEQSKGKWREQVRVGDLILVIDVGGGTTDLSLIAVVESGGSLELRRVAVGEHILLGGDNMDLALAHRVRSRLQETGKTIDNWQFAALTHAARKAKEDLLAGVSTKPAQIAVAARGSKLMGGTLRTELTREDVESLLVDGFFPLVGSDARPSARPRTALSQIGLPFAQDAAVTRHLASFLARHAGAEGVSSAVGLARPTAVLFNGGVFKGHALRQRVLDVLGSWFGSMRELQGADLDLSVARGAAYYGCVRRGKGVRIRGGTAKSFYVGIEGSAPAVPGVEPPIHALCVAPFGMEEGTEAALPPQEFGLIVGEPVRFRFWSSSVRRDDQVGVLLDRWMDGELEELAAIGATLPTDAHQPGEVVPVRLHASVTSVGTLELEALHRNGVERWKVELSVRDPSA